MSLGYRRGRLRGGAGKDRRHGSVKTLTQVRLTHLCCVWFGFSWEKAPAHGLLLRGDGNCWLSLNTDNRCTARFIHSDSRLVLVFGEKNKKTCKSPWTHPGWRLSRFIDHLSVCSDLQARGWGWYVIFYNLLSVFLIIIIIINNMS